MVGKRHENDSIKFQSLKESTKTYLYRLVYVRKSVSAAQVLKLFTTLNLKKKRKSKKCFFLPFKVV